MAKKSIKKALISTKTRAFVKTKAHEKAGKKKAKVLSVLIPVYNEEKTIEEIVKRIVSVKISGITKQIIIVDDNSTDNTRMLLKKIQKKYKGIKIILKDKNQGKGSAIITGIEHLKSDYTILQDADLEYDPNDYGVLLKPIMESKADVSFGSRFLGTHRAFMFWNYVANKFLNLMTNILFNTILTDMETCYKMMRTDIVKSLNLKSKGFDIEPEITAKILKRKYRLYEVPISYYGRTKAEGKKIRAIDGVIAVFAILKYRFMG